MRAKQHRLALSAVLIALLLSASFATAQDASPSSGADSAPAEPAKTQGSDISSSETSGGQTPKAAKSVGKAAAKKAAPVSETQAAAQLDGQIQDAIESQEARDVAAAPVIAHLIEEAPEAALASGDGDVSTIGALGFALQVVTVHIGMWVGLPPACQ